MVRRVSVPSDSVVVVGAGRSALIDELVSDGWTGITAVDISQTALEHLRTLLADRADLVRYIRRDVTAYTSDRPVAVWHDRATFHFLIEAETQLEYAHRAAEAVHPSGHLVLAVFGHDGPARCSGLPVARHDLASLISIFGGDFELVEHLEMDHMTPSGARQRFLHTLFRRNGPVATGAGRL